MVVKVHNIGYDRPRLSHRAYVDYLYECAARWRNEPGGKQQAERLQRQAEQMERLDESTCPVCNYYTRKGEK